MEGEGAGGLTATRGTRLAPRPVGPGALVGIAESLASKARWDRLDDLGERRWRLIAEADNFVAWLIAWPTGGALELHDHGGAAGAVAMAEGELVETIVRRGLDGGHHLHSRRLSWGRSLSFGPRHVHDVANNAGAPAVSVHVYSPRLTSMTFFSLEGGSLRPTRQAVVDCPEEPAAHADRILRARRAS